LDYSATPGALAKGSRRDAKVASEAPSEILNVSEPNLMGQLLDWQFGSSEKRACTI